MKYKFSFFLVIAMVVVGLMACSDNSEKDSPIKPKVSSQASEDDIIVKQEEINFVEEENALKEVFTEHADDISKKDLDEIMSHWLKSNSEDVFTAWTFWAGAFEKTVGWDDIKKGWVGIFRLRGGNMTINFLSVAIDSRAKNATLRAKYKWAASGDLIAAMRKDKKDKWKIRAIDYTNGRFGKQIKELRNPAYKNP